MLTRFPRLLVNNYSIYFMPKMQHSNIGPTIPNMDLDERLKQTVGYGSPYTTKIARKRDIPDITTPILHGQECLKWSKWSMRKHVLKRHLLSRYWQYRTNLKNIARCETLPKTLRDIASEERHDGTPRHSSINNIVNRCSLTSRGRGIYYRYKMSRMVWRDMADHGLISGAIRAKWR